MRFSEAKTKNPDLKDLSNEFRSKSNTEFFAAARKELLMTSGGKGKIAFGLLGQRDLPGVALRQAQSVLRWDRRPSLWSHAFFIEDADRICEVALYARNGEFPKPENNGVARASLEVYRDPKLDANAALIGLSVSSDAWTKIHARMKEPNADRIRYDLWRSLGAWQRYFWSDGTGENPLLNGVPMYCSLFIEMCFAAAAIDITPGASEQNSSPEHLWNTATWWHEAFAELDISIAGAYVLRDKGCSLLGTDE